MDAKAKTPVTVIGLGPMGRALAGAFAGNGHAVTLWNRTPGRAPELVEAGATEAATAAEAVAASPLVVVCVLDYDAAHAVLGPLGEDLRGKTVVNLTADTPERARWTAAWAIEHGIDYVDGAIMSPAATIGTEHAVVLYSGPEDVYRAYESALASFGGTGTYLGTDPGRAAGFDVSLLDLFWTTMTGYVHALTVAKAEGIAARDLAPLAKGIVGIMDGVIDEFAANVDDGTHPGDDSNIVSAAASLEHIVHTAGSRGIDTRVLAAAKDAADRAIAAGHGKDSYSRLVDTLGGAEGK
ncbi:NAD(P)-binding domain-containing protein [Streptomyces sp. TRM 70351]|uniref:NAD(P)-dependent oxidoreductase n=1 Tax=Streptomyces sp. TRM 70351 TaxID=3116552 RepID=UPI002E7BDFED|nr:NAD(P)-binding domain-containing protein [Streptomyces sp. TRM 70351]MEE1930495.1 NAD(P)-binding domain-containing protein [Streptomyces sp. TRM 70351]